MSNSSPEKLADNKLKKSYDASLPKTTEHLLGFRSRLAAGEVNVYRFVSVRSGDNSMLAKLIEVNEKIRTQQQLPEIKIAFSKGDVKVDQTTISKVYVHESYGSFHNRPLPSLSAIRAAQSDQNLISQLLKVNGEDYSTKELLDHNDTAALEQFRDYSTQVVTLVFQQGQQQSLIVT
jgi:alpha-L-arabinofuranosidase